MDNRTESTRNQAWDKQIEQGGKIAEMWVARDELGILLSLGIVLEARK